MKRMIYGRGAANDDLADVLHCLGTLHHDRGGGGQNTLARHHLSEALAMKRHIYGESAMNTDIAETLTNLAAVYRAGRDLDSAEGLYKGALQMINSDREFDDMTLEAAGFHAELGTLYCMRGDAVLAQEHYKATLDMQVELHGLGAASMDLVKALNNLGYVLALMGDYQGAILRYGESLKMQRRLCISEDLSKEVESTQKTLDMLYEKSAELERN